MWVYCKQCGYPLNGVGRNHCPECGCIFNPLDPSTFTYAKPHPNKPMWVVLSFMSPVVAYGFLWFLILLQHNGLARLDADVLLGLMALTLNSGSGLSYWMVSSVNSGSTIGAMFISGLITFVITWGAILILIFTTQLRELPYWTYLVFSLLWCTIGFFLDAAYVT